MSRRRKPPPVEAADERDYLAEALMVEWNFYVYQQWIEERWPPQVREKRAPYVRKYAHHVFDK